MSRSLSRFFCSSSILAIGLMLQVNGAYAASAPTSTDAIDPAKFVKSREDAFQLTIGGQFDIQGGYAMDSTYFINPKSMAPAVGANLPTPIFSPSYGRGLAIESNIRFQISNVYNDDLEYGGMVELNSNVSPSPGGNRNGANKVMVFMQNQYGRAEIGSYDGANVTMRVTPINFAKGTGGVDGAYNFWLPYTVVSQNYNTQSISAMSPSDSGNLIVVPGLFIDSPYLPCSGEYSKKANKVTFYTKENKGWSFGLSFIPDSGIKGTSYQMSEVNSHAYRNVMGGGVKYQRQINDTVWSASLVGEMGSAPDRTYYWSQAGTATGNPLQSITTTLKRQGLAAWEAGIGLEHKGLELAAAYGDWGKSGNPTSYANTLPSGYTSGAWTLSSSGTVTPSSNTSKYLTLGAARTYDKWGLSVGYMRSWRSGSPDQIMYQMMSAGPASSGGAEITPKPNINSNTENTLFSFSAAVEYAMRPGLVPYAELTKYNYNTSLPYIQTDAPFLAILGLKLNF